MAIVSKKERKPDDSSEPLEQKCPMCGKVIGKTKDKTRVEMLCGNAKCGRMLQWRNWTEEQRITEATYRGVGEYYIRDGKLPRLIEYPHDVLVQAAYKHKNLLICGEPASGKTQALCALMVEALEDGKTAAFDTQRGMNLLERNCHDHNSDQSSSNYIRSLVIADVLCIDDYLNQRWSEWMDVVLGNRLHRDKVTHIATPHANDINNSRFHTVYLPDPK